MPQQFQETIYSINLFLTAGRKIKTHRKTGRFINLRSHLEFPDGIYANLPLRQPLFPELQGKVALRYPVMRALPFR
jgi:hypothetical protein